MSLQTEKLSDTVPVRRLDLAPEDFERLSWWPARVYERREPDPFDADACVGNLEDNSDEDLTNPYWEKVGIPPVMTPQEARFWLAALLLPPDDMVSGRAAQLVAQAAAQTPALGTLLKWLRDVDGSVGEWVALCVSHLYASNSFWPALFEQEAKTQAAATSPLEEGWVAMARGFGKFWSPFLSLEEREVLREHVRGILPRTSWPPLYTSGGYRARPLPWLMAAQLGMAEEVRAVVEGWADGSFEGSQGRIYAYNQGPQEMILRLGSSELVEYHMRRLKLTPRTPEQIRSWLAATEFRGLDLVRNRVLYSRSKSGAAQAITELGRALAPETALLMLQVSLESKAAKTALQWLDRYPRLTAFGVAAEAARRSKLGDAALDILRDFCRRRQTDLVRSALKSLPEETATKVRQRLGDALEQ